MANSIFLGRASDQICLLAAMANRHGLISGATGTGKTITLQVMAEGFSRLGVPVFMADVKGDLAGISRAGSDNPKIQERVAKLDISDFAFDTSPATFWDLYGERGHPVRATISEMGPVLLSRLLDLNEVQSGVLSVAFRVADDNGMLLLDLKDLRAMLQFISDNASELQATYGNIAGASVGAIQRNLLALEQQGAEKFFGEPALTLRDLIQVSSEGRGVINVLSAERLMQYPRLYATFLLWLLSELFEQLPEVGDLEKPKLVFFFDEAHLLFDEAPKVLLEKIEQVVRLIRSKGVGVYFITQSPLDIPADVLGQLGNRVQHALRAFTPQDQKVIKAAAQTFRANSTLNVEQTISELGVGEALVSFLDQKGIPMPVERTLIPPPRSQIGPISDEARAQTIKSSLLYGKYEQVIDRESAFEILKKKAQETPVQGAEQTSTSGASSLGSVGKIAGAMAQSAARAVGTQLGRQILRGILGSFLGGSSRKKY